MNDWLAKALEIVAEEAARRRLVVEALRANAKAEGRRISPEAEAILDRWVDAGTVPIDVPDKDV